MKLQSRIMISKVQRVLAEAGERHCGEDRDRDDQVPYAASLLPAEQPWAPQDRPRCTAPARGLFRPCAA